MKKQLITLLLGVAATATSMAVPAKRQPVSVTGPDGNEITVTRVGDEFANYFVDTEGRMMLRQGDCFVYASPEQQQARMAMRRVPNRVGKFPGSTFPTKGEQKAIVILVEYQDVKFKIGNDERAHQYYTDMLNKKGFSEYSGTGSVHDYFIDQSNGQFDCQFDLYGPITLSQKRAYYGANDRYGNDQHPEEMVIEACQQLDETVNFADYDRDGDGIIDNVYVIYAGIGEASDVYGNTPESVWPHSWDVSFMNLRFDGKKLATYGCSNEWEDYYGRPDGIGTFVHEFSHVMGLPDLYHTTSTSAMYTPGEWSVLDYGPYNNDGRTPPAYSAFERNAMEWIDLKELEAGDLNLPSLTATNTAYCVTNPQNPNEYYLFESRAKTGWDKYIPYTGMLVWHVDYNATVWNNNAVNNTQSHQYVDLVEADGKATKSGGRTGGDCYPGSTNKKTFEAKWWNNSSIGLTLSDIAIGPANSITFTVVDPNAGTEPDPGTEPGDEEFITVSGVLARSSDDSKQNVRGFIVGYANNAFSAAGVKFTSEGCIVNTNLVLADSADELQWGNTIPVQLVNNSSARTDLNLRDNPAMLGQYVQLTGTLSTYFSNPGLKNVSTYQLLEAPTEEPGEGGNQDGINEVMLDGTSTIIFDLQGRRVTNPTHGLYIINGQKVMK